MQLFILTQHCKTQVHCKTCRAKEGGRVWRKKLMEDFALPNNNVDFVCPYGQEWQNETVSHTITAVSITDKTVSKQRIVHAPPMRKETGSRDGSGCGCSRSR